MFAVLRKLVVVSVAVVAGIALWEAAGVRTYVTTPASRPHAVDGPLPIADGQPASDPLIPGSRGHRLLVWALFVLLTPVITAPLAGRILGKESNTANVLLLFGYTGLDVFAACLVGGIHVGGILSGIVHLVGLLAIFSYNLWICSFLARLKEV